MTAFFARLARLLERRKNGVLACLLLVYCLDAGRRAAGLPLWFDEIFTFYIAKLSLGDMWAALLTAADSQPPLGYLLTRASHFAFGTGELATRVPYLVSFGVMSACLFQFVAARLGPVYGFVAMLFAWTTSGYQFGYEARPYGLMLATSALALLCWRHAARGQKGRAWALPGLALSLGAMVSSHYYAVLVFLPLGAGELVRSRKQRRADWAVWAAMAAGGTPLLAYLPLIQAARNSFTGSFWSPVEWTDLISLYVLLLYTAVVPVLSVTAFLLAQAWGRRGADKVIAPAFPPEERVVLWTLALLPPVAAVLAMMTTGAFVYRYVISAMIGISALFAVMVHYVTRAQASRGAVVALILFCSYGVARLSGWSESPRDGTGESAMLLQRLLQSDLPEELPIAVTAPHLFIEAFHSAPEPLASRLVYLADPESALEYLGFSTTELNLLRLAPWAHLRVYGYGSFMERNADFLLYHRPGHRYEWITRKLADEDRQITVLEQGSDFSILRCCGGGLTVAAPDGQ